MLTKLQEIINYKKEELLFKKDKTTEQELEFQIDKQEKTRAFIKTLDKPNQLNLIAEIKKASPSKEIGRAHV